MSTNNDDILLYQQWKGFLQQSARLDVRLAAIQAVYEHSSSTDIPDNLWSHGVLPLIHFDDEADSLQHNQIAAIALQCLQNRTSTEYHADWVDSLWTRLIEVALSRMPSSTRSQEVWRQCIDTTCAILVNLSRDEAGAIALVGTTLPEYAIYRSSEEEDTAAAATSSRIKPTLELLLSRFLSLQYILKDDKEEAADPYQHLANVLMNITQVDLGRRFFLQLHHHSKNTTTTTTSVLQQLLPQLQSANSIRRCGVAGLCRNICVAESDSVDWLLHTVNISTHLLLPLAGNEELDVDEKQGLDPALWLFLQADKQRELDTQTRLYLVEAVLALLKTNRAARHCLRLKRAYVILKYADLTEEDEAVSEQIYECVNYLRGDEEGSGEGSSDRAVAAAYPALSGTVEAAAVDYDQVD